MDIFKSTSFVNRPSPLTDSTGDGSVSSSLKILTFFYNCAKVSAFFSCRQPIANVGCVNAHA